MSGRLVFPSRTAVEEGTHRMPSKQSHAKLSASLRFFGAYHKLPLSAQGPVWECVSKLMRDPAHPSLNYEGIRQAGDSRLRSVRVNDQYRLIVARADGGSASVLLWVDKHDAAYAWAARHRLEISDEAAGLALVEYAVRQEEPAPPSASPTAPAAQAAPPMPAEQPTQGNLHLYSDQQLVQVGVPEQLLPALRACRTDMDVQNLLGTLPAPVADLVLDVWTGEPRAVPVSQLSPPPEPQRIPSSAAPDTLEIALRRPGSARQFVSIASEEDLKHALKYPLELWRVFLHPEQQSIVQANFDGPALVSGGAGTGKTVVGLHRAHYLAAQVFTAPQERVLLTTYTANLADNLSTLMNSLCADDATLRKRIEVTHVHSLVASVRHRASENFTIVSDDLTHQLMADTVKRCDTLGLLASFYQSEWQEIAQEREALTEEAYLQVDRAGRGRGLNRRQRAAVWKVLEAYAQALDAAKREEWATATRRACHLLETHRVLLPQRYRAVIVDEAQDLGTPEMRFLLALLGQQRDNALLLLGDTRQQIYARGSSVRLLNIPIERRHRKLRLNYRTTEQIRSAASDVLTSSTALTGELLGADDSISLLRGPTPRVRVYTRQAEEEEEILTRLRGVLASGMAPEEILLVARTNSLLDHYASLLQAAGLAHFRIDGKSPRGAGIQLATMHRAKGLEFRAVFIVGCSTEILPQPYKGDDDEVARTEHLGRERRLLYVAMTRARELLWISASGKLSPFLEEPPKLA